MRIMFQTMFVLLLCSTGLHAQNYLYQEQFSGGEADNEWHAGFNGNAMLPVNYPGNPSGDRWVGKLDNHFSGGNVGQSWSGSPEMTNYYYEAQVYIPVDGAVYYGLEFRVDTTGLTSGYQFVARFRPGGMLTPRLRFRLRPDDNPAIPQTIRDWEAGEIPGGIPQVSGWHKLAVLARGHEFWFWFNDQLLPGCPVLDYSRVSGAIGAYLWDDVSPLMSMYIDDINVTSDPLVSVAHTPPLPDASVLPQNHPNPFSGTTVVSYELPAPSWMTLAVYSMEGRRLAVLHEGMQDAGIHRTTWNPGDRPSGMYMLRLTTPGGVRQRNIMHIR